MTAGLKPLRTLRRLSPVALAVAVVLLQWGCAAEADPLERARAAARQNDREEAILLYRAYLDDHPDDYAVLKEYTLTLGEQWAYAGGDRGPLLESLERLYGMRPGDRQVQSLLSLMLVREGQAARETRRYEEAETLLRRAIAVNPDSGNPQYHLGRLYDEWGKDNEAFIQYRAAAAKRPPIPDLYLQLGREYLERGEVEMAISTLGLVLELRGMSSYLLPQAHCALAQAYARRGMREEARRHLDEASADCTVPGA